MTVYWRTILPYKKKLATKMRLAKIETSQVIFWLEKLQNKEGIKH